MNTQTKTSFTIWKLDQLTTIFTIKQDKESERNNMISKWLDKFKKDKL